ncbi:DUF1054 family protein [Secundilactobacillus paracollinoides]|uniref:Uncharacterized protein n=1 Tax=Secundilactobacillus paracollinoides TaxID=240427 RepID=A0A1B2IZY3_9LACO|nr:DUF1054 family protein [Secundilactobacillus paracollinoides]ANZ61703.1 hypothetical protein AYR61_10255 [Secundilactobacillus paracollinoides]ANZ67621.1 hypothetical protein AYR63_11000 [Secundilactobacillus paracollinoides]
MFNQEDFDVFKDQTLAGRMAGVRGVIDPKFEAIAPTIKAALGQDQPVSDHIAKHLRRFKNPPMNTWIAFNQNPRGYKMTPHLMLGFGDDRLFLWLASLAEATDRDLMINRWQRLLPELVKLPSRFEISPDHMAKKSGPVTMNGLKQQLTRYETVKQADFMVGRQWLQDDDVFNHPNDLKQILVDTTHELAPFYSALVADK